MANIRTNNAKITGGSIGVTLGDLRWLVTQAEGGKDDLIVRVDKEKGDMHDPGYCALALEIPIPETPVVPPAPWNHPTGARGTADYEGPYGYGNAAGPYS